MACPPALTWMLVKDHNCFLYKRNGQTKRSGAIAMSAEPFNLTNTNTFKSSGLANDQAVDVSYDASKDTEVPLTLSLKVRVSAAARARRPPRAHPSEARAMTPSGVGAAVAGEEEREQAVEAGLEDAAEEELPPRREGDHLADGRPVLPRRHEGPRARAVVGALPLLDGEEEPEEEGEGQIRPQERSERIKARL